MYTYTLYDCEGFFVTQVIANSPEEALSLLGVSSDIAVFDNAGEQIH